MALIQTCMLPVTLYNYMSSDKSPSKWDSFPQGVWWLWVKALTINSRFPPNWDSHIFLQYFKHILIFLKVSQQSCVTPVTCVCSPNYMVDPPSSKFHNEAQDILTIKITYAQVVAAHLYKCNIFLTTPCHILSHSSLLEFPNVVEYSSGNQSKCWAA